MVLPSHHLRSLLTAADGGRCAGIRGESLHSKSRATQGTGSLLQLLTAVRRIQDHTENSADSS